MPTQTLSRNSKFLIATYPAPLKTSTKKQLKICFQIFPGKRFFYTLLFFLLTFYFVTFNIWLTKTLYNWRHYQGKQLLASRSLNYNLKVGRNQSWALKIFKNCPAETVKSAQNTQYLSHRKNNGTIVIV